MVLLSVFVLFSLGTLANADVGLRLSIKQKGLEKAKDIALPLIRGALNGTISIPDLHLDEHVAEPIGHITLDLTDIRISAFTLASGSVALQAPSTLAFGLDGIGFALALNYKWRKVHFPHASDHGTITADPSGTSFSTDIAFVVTPAGAPQAHQVGGQTNIENFKIHFEGKVAWLYNLFVKLLSGDLKKSIGGAITKAVSKVIETKLDAALAKWPASLHIGGGKSEVDIDTTLVHVLATAGDSGYLAWDDSFAIQDHMTSEACPHHPTQMPFLTPEAEDSMIQILFADVSVACIAHVAFANGALKFDVPAGTTGDWALIIPALAIKYPKENVTMALSPISEPSFHSTKAAGLRGQLDFLANSSVMPPQGGPKVYTHTLGASVDFAVDVFTNNTANGTLIEGNITSLQLNLTVVDSAIGKISRIPLEALDKILIPIIRKVMDKVLLKGIPLPTGSGLELVNEKVVFDDGFLSINSDFTVNTSKV